MSKRHSRCAQFLSKSFGFPFATTLGRNDSGTPVRTRVWEQKQKDNLKRWSEAIEWRLVELQKRPESGVLKRDIKDLEGKIAAVKHKLATTQIC